MEDLRSLHNGCLARVVVVGRDTRGEGLVYTRPEAFKVKEGKRRVATMSG